MVNAILLASRLAPPVDLAPIEASPTQDVPPEAPSVEAPSVEAPPVEAPPVEARPATPTTAPTPAPSQPEPKAVRRWARSGPWVSNAWPTRQVCTLDADRAPLCVLIRADVFTGFRAGRIGGTSMNEFRVDRAEIGTDLLWKPAPRVETGGVIGVEAIRSAGPQSVTGIDGAVLGREQRLQRLHRRWLGG